MASVEDLAALFSEFWEWRLREWPEYASYCGDHRYDDCLNVLTEEAFMRRKKDVEEFLSRCQKFEAETLDMGCRTSLAILTDELETFIRGIDTKAYVFPLSNMEGIHMDFELVTSWMKFDVIEDYEKYLGRLEQLPKRIEEDIAMLQLGCDLNRTFSIQCLEKVPGQLKDLDKEDVTATVFYQPITKAKDLGPNLEKLQGQAKAVIKNEILPMFRKLHQFLTDTYLPACRPTPGVLGMSGGRQFYEKVLRWHLSLPMTPQEVHDIGLREIARIQQEMLQVKEKVGFKDDLKLFFAHLKGCDKFYLKDKEELLSTYRNIADNKIRPTLPKLFHKMPQSALEICGLSESRTSGPAAYYLAGTLDGSRPGKFYINTANISESPTYDMMTLALHEGEPGHHFQGMYAIEAKDLPLFRRYIEDMYYCVAPCRFGIHAAYGEGWGLYCEYLGKELGLYEDSYALFGHLSYEMFRACRLVADTGLHYFGWSFDQAVDLFLENTALSKENIVVECMRYCTIPGQACAYKIGQIRIQELRAKAAKELGSKFDVRDFHEEVLRIGMVPINILEQVIADYIKSVKCQLNTGHS